MQTDLILRLNRDAFVLIPGNVLGVMKGFTIGSQGATEAGGILIGSYRGNHIEVRDCTVPLRRDVRRACFFDRRDKGHQLAAMCAWTRSFGTETFVGEWHTHPEDFPLPSIIDHGTWAGIIKRKDLPVVFIIAGRKGIWAGAGRYGEVFEINAVLDEPA